MRPPIEIAAAGLRAGDAIIDPTGAFKAMSVIWQNGLNGTPAQLIAGHPKIACAIAVELSNGRTVLLHPRQRIRVIR